MYERKLECCVGIAIRWWPHLRGVVELICWALFMFVVVVLLEDFNCFRVKFFLGLILCFCLKYQW